MNRLSDNLHPIDDRRAIDVGRYVGTAPMNQRLLSTTGQLTWAIEGDQSTACAQTNPYKASINRWLWPDVFKNQDTSVAKAKKPIADYKKAIGQAEGLAELMVFYCERAAGFSMEVGLQDKGYFDALVRMFQQALKTVASLAATQRPPMWERLDAVRRTSHNFGYGVGDEMDDLLAEYGAND